MSKLLNYLKLAFSSDYDLQCQVHDAVYMDHEGPSLWLAEQRRRQQKQQDDLYQNQQRHRHVVQRVFWTIPALALLAIYLCFGWNILVMVLTVCAMTTLFTILAFPEYAWSRRSRL